MLFIFVSLCALSFILRSSRRRHNSSVIPTVIPSAPTVIPSAASVSPIARTAVIPGLTGNLSVIPSAASVSHPEIIHKSITK